MNIGIYPGSFDPITVGHIDIIEKAIKLFDEVHVVVAVNYDKTHMFSIKDRREIVNTAIEQIKVPHGKKIIVVSYEGIVSRYAKSVNANGMIRGLRNHIDLQYEQNIEQFTKKTAPEVETIYFSSEAKNLFTSSSLVRQLIMVGNIKEAKSYMSPISYNHIVNIINKNKSKFIKEFKTIVEK